jgi:hypothetical protein
MSVLQNLNVDPVKEMAAELAAEETTPSAPEPSIHRRNQEDAAKEFDAETQETEAPRAEALPETAEAEETEVEDTGNKTVPLKALREARERVRQAEERIRQYENYVAQQEGYQRALSEQQAQYQQPQAEIPDPETDPIGALRYEREQRQQLTQQLEQERVYREGQAAQVQFTQQYTTDMRAFVQQKPEVAQAYQYAFNNRLQELIALGEPPAQAHQRVQQEEINLAFAAYQAGVHPAERILAVAQSRGFKPAVQAIDAAKQVENAKAKSVAATGVAKGGNAPKSDVKPEDLLNLTGAAFDKAWEKLAAQSKKPIQLR